MSKSRQAVWKAVDGGSVIKSGEVLTLEIHAWDLLDTDVTIELYEQDSEETGRDDALGSVTGQVKSLVVDGKPTYWFEASGDGFEQTEVKNSYASFSLMLPGILGVPVLHDVVKIGELEMDGAGKGVYEIGFRIKQGNEVLEPESGEPPQIALVEQAQNSYEHLKRFLPWTPQWPSGTFEKTALTPLGYLPTAEHFFKLGCGHISATILLRYWGELDDKDDFVKRAGLRWERRWQPKAGGVAPGFVDGVKQDDEAALAADGLYSALPYKPFRDQTADLQRLAGELKSARDSWKRSNKKREKRTWPAKTPLIQEFEEATDLQKGRLILGNWDFMHLYARYTQAEILDQPRRERDPLLWSWWWRQNFVFANVEKDRLNMSAAVLTEWLERFPHPPSSSEPKTYETKKYTKQTWNKTLSWLSQAPPVPVVFTVRTTSPAGKSKGHFMLAIGIEAAQNGRDPCILVHDSGGWFNPKTENNGNPWIEPAPVRREWRAQAENHVRKITEARWNARVGECYAIRRLDGIYEAPTPRTDWTTNWETA